MVSHMIFPHFDIYSKKIIEKITSLFHCITITNSYTNTKTYILILKNTNTYLDHIIITPSIFNRACSLYLSFNH